MKAIIKKQDIISKINEVLDYNARLLRINKPVIIVKPAEAFTTPTTRAALSEDATVLAVNENYIHEYLTNDRGFWLYFSHEARHIWQQETGFGFDDYVPSGLTDLDAYNSQAAEIDAHAWAAVVVKQKLHIIPDYSTVYSSDVVRKIKQRIAEIED